MSPIATRVWAQRLALGSLPLLLPACSDDESAPNNALTVVFQVSTGHIHTFETDVTFNATVSTAAGDPIEDFTTLEVELGQTGTENWTKTIPLGFNGTLYTTTTKLTATGTFDVRLMGQRPSQSEPTELQRAAEPISASRPHFDAGGYRVEFETDTGEYPVAGQPVTLRFLIMEDVSSPRPPVTGLTGVLIRCTEGSSVQVHDALESPAGLYSAAHTFVAGGDVSAEVEFTGLDLNPATVVMPLIVTP